MEPGSLLDTIHIFCYHKNPIIRIKNDHFNIAPTGGQEPLPGALRGLMIEASIFGRVGASLVCVLVRGFNLSYHDRDL